MVALDYGRRRIGVAISDPGRILASPHGAIEHRGPAGEPPDGLLGPNSQFESIAVAEAHQSEIWFLWHHGSVPLCLQVLSWRQAG